MSITCCLDNDAMMRKPFFLNDRRIVATFCGSINAVKGNLGTKKLEFITKKLRKRSEK